MEIEKKNVDTYNLIATDFSDKRYNMWDWIQIFLSNFVSNNNILDVGCGNGRNIPKTKIDINESNLVVI